MKNPSKRRAFLRFRTPKFLRPLRQMLKDRAQLADYREFACANEFKTGQISFSPKLPVRTMNVLPKICAELGWAVEKYNPRTPTRLTVFWPRTEGVFPAQPDGWINSRCLNIDKSRVAAASEKAFGFSYLVDPATHHGEMVSKSETNAVHDGIVLRGPSPRQPGRIYMRCVDNVQGDEVEDIRVIYMGGVLPFAYLKYRPIAQRFSNTNSRAEIIGTSDYIQPHEVAGIDLLCRDVGLECGELDCLRDRTDGMLYVIDVSRTPSGPPNGLSAEEKARAVRMMAPFFLKAFGAPPPA